MVIQQSNLDAGAQGDPLGYGMQPQSESNAQHTSRMGCGITVLVVMVMMAVIVRFTAEVVLMKVENVQHKDHHDNSYHHPYHGCFPGVGAGNALKAVGQ